MLKTILFFISILILINVQAQETIRVNNPFNSPELEFMTAIWTEVTNRNDIELIMQETPNKRSIINANSGIDDADAARILTISKFYPNLIPVPETLYNFEIVAITKREDMILKELEHLKPYHVGIIRGMKIAEIKTAEVNPGSIVKTTDYKSLLSLLEKGRIDVALVDKMGILNEILKSQEEGLYYMHLPALINVQLYMQLNKKIGKYVLPFEKSLKEIKSDGTYQKILQEHIDLDVSSKVKIL